MRCLLYLRWAFPGLQTSASRRLRNRMISVACLCRKTHRTVVLFGTGLGPSHVEVLCPVYRLHVAGIRTGGSLHLAICSLSWQDIQPRPSSRYAFMDVKKEDEDENALLADLGKGASARSNSGLRFVEDDGLPPPVEEQKCCRRNCRSGFKVKSERQCGADDGLPPPVEEQEQGWKCCRRNCMSSFQDPKVWCQVEEFRAKHEALTRQDKQHFFFQLLKSMRGSSYELLGLSLCEKAFLHLARVSRSFVRRLNASSDSVQPPEDGRSLRTVRACAALRCGC